jgi:A/G-specific adenine glycosylase
VPKPRYQADPLARGSEFRAALAAWFRRAARDYPWRRTADPYAILVSEVMLQQTQVRTVLERGFFTRFLERFPDTAALARADDDALLKAWEGLGYYRRARMLRAAARAIETEHGGAFPGNHDALLALPGVGPYTAGAVASFAFGEARPIVDGNVARVLSRLFDIAEPVDASATQARLWKLAGELLDPAAPALHNSALMELGQTFCRPGQPDCGGCPVARFCRCREPRTLPVKSRRTAVAAVDEDLVWARRGGRLLLCKQVAGRRAGMWRLPEGRGRGAVLYQAKYAITRYRVTMRVRRAAPGRAPRPGEKWQPITGLADLVMPPADRAAVRDLLRTAEESS